MKKFKYYFNIFFSGNQSGIETIEFIGLVVVAAVLIAIVAGIGSSFSNQASSAENQMNDALNDLTKLFDE